MLAVKCGHDEAAAKLIEHGADISVKNKVVQLCLLCVLQLSPCTRVMSSPNKVVQLCVLRVLQLSSCTRVMISPNKVVQLCVRRVLQLSPCTRVRSSLIW